VGELHVDSIVVVHAIMMNEIEILHRKTLVERIRWLIDLYWEVVVVHQAYREAKKCVDAIGNFGCKMTYGFVFFDNCPSAIRLLLLADILGNTTL
jgi:hypothetical protein